MDGITATPRLSLQAAASATAPAAAPVILVELDFASGPFRAWTGLGPLDWAEMVFEGVGSLGVVGKIEETTEIRAVRLTLVLSPVPQEVVDIASPSAASGSARSGFGMACSMRRAPSWPTPFLCGPG